MKKDSGASMLEVLVTMLILTITMSSLFKALQIPFSLLGKSDFNLPFLKYELNACKQTERRGLKTSECKSPLNPKAKIFLIE